MRYLDTYVLENMAARPRARVARARRYVWLVWQQPHFRPHAGKFGIRTAVRWPVYLLHGGAA